MSKKTYDYEEVVELTQSSYDLGVADGKSKRTKMGYSLLLIGVLGMAIMNKFDNSKSKRMATKHDKLVEKL